MGKMKSVERSKCTSRHKQSGKAVIVEVEKCALID